ncbi:polysaccharide deacetylase family protein [Paenibacillus sp. N1-5-1-14]|uniref:polysaccharide deacetylase family protein n=1 Tax=Paenibacillus radicibacter TaxID=2972488 RepID=UPI002158D216|nr:polysaccharide deacetylase family protein [Paenibacillus radicibacter]MCR8641083.1 polysaccharide deacetylase family protein [Paenibacillus radicibacter]
MLYIYHPPGYEAERTYILHVIFDVFLGLPYKAFIEQGNTIRIVATEDGLTTTTKQLVIHDVLMQTKERDWLTIPTLPVKPLDRVADDTHDDLPVIYGRKLPNGSYSSFTEKSITLGIDLFGSIFYMLTRYEELVLPDRDARARFPVTASLAYQENFLNRPIVNEYVELLYQCLQQLYPQMTRRQRSYRIHLSHDVDVPLFAAGRTFKQVVRHSVGDVVKRKSVATAAKRMRAYVGGHFNNYDWDEANTFDFIMNLSERKGLQSAFYFITNRSAGSIDGDYSMQEPWIRMLLRDIHTRNHEIGLHPSYLSFDRPEIIQHEFSILQQVCQEEGIEQEQWGGRQHFLRFDAACTWQAWESSGLHYDSTLSFAEHVGFRSGVCYEYPVFDLRIRRQLKLQERPLIVMEQSLIHENYMDVSTEVAYAKMLELAHRCKRYQGDFTLLWHNDQLVEPEYRNLYQSIVEAI